MRLFPRHIFFSIFLFCLDRNRLWLFYSAKRINKSPIFTHVYYFNLFNIFIGRCSRQERQKKKNESGKEEKNVKFNDRQSTVFFQIWFNDGCLRAHQLGLVWSRLFSKFDQSNDKLNFAKLSDLIIDYVISWFSLHSLITHFVFSVDESQQYFLFSFALRFHASSNDFYQTKFWNKK